MANGDVPDDEGIVPIGVAKTVRTGTDLTLVSWSRMVHLCEEVAETLAGDGVSVEVIDLRTLWPWDTEAVYASVRRTGRLLVAQEAVQVGGFAAEVATDVTEHCFDALKTHVRRIGAPRMPVPYAEPMENEFRVTPARILDRARETLTA